MDRPVSKLSVSWPAKMAVASASDSSASSALPEAVQFAASAEPVRDATRSAGPASP